MKHMATDTPTDSVNEGLPVPHSKVRGRRFTATARITNWFKSASLSPLVRWYQDTWMLEYLSLVLSFGCLLAIFAILLSFNGKASKTWHSNLSVNSVLAIIATVLKGTTLFAAASAMGQLKWAWYHSSARSLRDFQTIDSASRGPFGAVSLFWRLPNSTLACLGSLIMIIGLGSDTSIQMSTSQPLRSILSSTASIPVVQHYRRALGSVFDPLLINWLYTGIFNAQVLRHNDQTVWGDELVTLNPLRYSISPLCSTGNCTFQPYASLAVHHRCLDLTESLQYAEGSNATQRSVTLSFSPSFPPLDTTEAHNLTSNYSGLTELKYDFTRLTMFSSVPDLSLHIPALPYTTESFPFVETFMIIHNGTQLNITQPHFLAFRCNLDYGMQVYEGSIRYGVFMETPRDFVRGNWTLKRDNQTSDNEWDTYWSLDTVTSGIKHQVKIDQDIWSLTTLNIPGYFTETITTDAQRRGSELSYVIVESVDSMAFGTSIGIDAVFDSIAKGLSSYFRTATNEFVIGTTEGQEQFIQVRWQWLLVATVMVFCNTIFVLCISLQSHRAGLPGWKNSALALMLSKTISEDVTEATQQEPIWIGPPRPFNRISILERWATTRLAKVRVDSLAKEEDTGLHGL